MSELTQFKLAFIAMAFLQIFTMWRWLRTIEKNHELRRKLSRLKNE